LGIGTGAGLGVENGWGSDPFCEVIIGGEVRISGRVYEVAKQVIVDDSKDNIRQAILSMLDCNLVFTSGGTGFFERDNTPEVTAEIIEKRADSLMVYVT
jgi:molybdopterin biosynthesis enzyme MoaB